MTSPSPDRTTSATPAFDWRRGVFSLVVLFTLALIGFLGLVLLQPGLIAGLLGHDTAAHAAEHFRQSHHRIHDLTFAFLFGTAVVGLLGQLRTPSRNVAGQVMALIPWVSLALVVPLTKYWVARGTGFVIVATAIFGTLTLAAAMLHPSGRGFFRSFSVSRVNGVMLALVIAAAVPLLSLATNNIRLQRSVTNDHAALGHYGFMAAFGFTVIGVGLLASLRPDGWRIAAWVAGILPTLVGLASVVLPDVDSSLGLGWALAAIVWGAVFVGAAELTRRTVGRSLLESRMANGDTSASLGRGSLTGRARWVYVIGIVGVLLVLLLVVLHLAGGFGGHAVTP